MRGFQYNEVHTYHIVSRSGAVSGQSHLVVLALHVVPPQPDGVVGVGAGQQTLGELHRAINCVAVAAVLINEYVR